MSTKKEEPANWTVRVSARVLYKNTSRQKTEVRAELLCNGTVVHELGGATAEESLQRYADLLNARKAPAPKPRVKVGADGGGLPLTTE